MNPSKIEPTSKHFDYNPSDQQPPENWQQLIWREWRYCDDESYAMQLFELVADEPISGWGLGALIALGLILGGIGGWFLAVLGGEMGWPYADIVLWLVLAMALSVGVGLGLLGHGLGRRQRLSWRLWLAGLQDIQVSKSTLTLNFVAITVVVSGVITGLFLSGTNSDIPTIVLSLNDAIILMMICACFSVGLISLEAKHQGDLSRLLEPWYQRWAALQTLWNTIETWLGPTIGGRVRSILFPITLLAGGGTLMVFMFIGVLSLLSSDYPFIPVFVGASVGLGVGLILGRRVGLFGLLCCQLILIVLIYLTGFDIGLFLFSWLLGMWVTGLWAGGKRFRTISHESKFTPDQAYHHRRWYVWWRKRPLAQQLIGTLQNQYKHKSWADLLSRFSAQPPLPLSAYNHVLTSYQSLNTWQDRFVARYQLVGRGGGILPYLLSPRLSPLDRVPQAGTQTLWRLLRRRVDNSKTRRLFEAIIDRPVERFGWIGLMVVGAMFGMALMVIIFAGEKLLWSLLGGAMGGSLGGLLVGASLYGYRRYFFWWRQAPTQANIEQAQIEQGRYSTSSVVFSQGLDIPDSLRHWLIENISQQTTQQLASWDEESLWCPTCIAPCVEYSLRRGIRLSHYYGCRVCQQSLTFWHFPQGTALQVVAVFDSTWAEPYQEQGNQLRVNVLVWAKLFDFNTIEIKQASDEQIERFVVQIGNEADLYRQALYQTISCTIAPNCHLSENTIRILQRTFAHVTQ